MFFSPIIYDEPLFRPPAEAFSLIFQVTIGCSWNKCAFCEMYSTKKFKVKKEEEIIDKIEKASKYFPETKKIFLADGNAMVLSTSKLLKILEAIHKHFPRIMRVSSYALPNDVSSKTDEELRQLREAGLKLIYVGIETGDDELLKLINKSETFDSTVEGLLKAKKAGIKSSVMIVNGLGGKKYSEQHAVNSAKLLNIVQPEFTSTLVLSFPFGENFYKNKFSGEYISMTTTDLLKEMEILISNTDLNSSIFRSNHASNFLVLEGILSRDKEKLLHQIRSVLNNNI